MQLLPFQEKAVADMFRILRARGSVYNAYEMGLGKTIQSIRACQNLNIIDKNCYQVLIVCPAIVRLVWEKEIIKWHQFFIEIEFHAFSYEHVTRNAEALLKCNKWDCLILDEAHYIKNKDTKRARAIFTHLWPNIRYKICLSGTPMTKSVMDCWSLFSRLAPEHFGDYWKFYHTYAKIQQTPFGEKVIGIKNANKLKERIRSTFFIRETLETVGHQLPEKTWQKITLPESLAVKMTLEEEKEHQKYVEALIKSFKSGVPVRAVPPKASATWRKEQGLKKLESIIEFSQNLLDQDIPIVIFCYHKEFVTKLKEALKKFKPVVITGDTNAADRESAVRTFQEGGTNLFIGNIEAAGVGITLTRSSTVLLAELSWIPSTIQQAVSRCHRISQRNHVHIYYFVVENSLDEKMIEVVVDRAKDFKSVLE